MAAFRPRYDEFGTFDFYARGLANDSVMGRFGLAMTAPRSSAAITVPAFTGTTAVLPYNSGLPDNHQPVESAWYIPGPTALIDVYAPSPATTGTLVVDGAHVIAACDTPGDNDWFAVTLTAGETYQFGQYAWVGGIPGAEGNGIPLADAYLEIRDSAGNLLAIADGGGPNTPNGLDALLTFEATYSGVYYVNATSYDQTGDGVGDFAGDYEIFARTAAPGTSYVTPYDISSPLHSLDWGGVMVNREHVAVNNPDGQEGPRPTGQAAADPADVEGNALGFPGKNVIYLYFAGEGDLYANVDSTIPAQVTAQDPYQYEIQAMLTAANEFSKVADVVFVSNYSLNATTGLYERNPNIEYRPGPSGPQAGVQYATGVDDGFDADFFYWSYPGTPGPGVSLLGSMSPPDYGDEGTAQFNSADERWNAQMLQQGGFSFVTLIHEFGHGMGLAHPHDTGGGSSIMLDGDTASGRVEETTPFSYTLGDFDLNQGIYTVMSYMDGWQLSPYGQPDTVNEGYGWLGSLMAFDIAVIQDKYGVNEDWAAGNDTYVLKDVNEWGVYIDSATGQPAVHDASNQTTTRDGYYQGQSTYYSSIWDANGVDQIIYNGARNTNIDLRAATLQYEHGGAGWVSYATGIYGGYTIANGVVIENATTGSGNDTLIGNSANNVLDSGDGNDLIDLSAGGDDSALGGAGDDGFLFGAAFTAADQVNGGAGTNDQIGLQGNYSGGLTLGAGTMTGVEALVVLPGFSYNITTVDANVAAGQVLKVQATQLAAGQGLTFNGSAETDGSFLTFGGQGNDNFTGGGGNDGFYFGPGGFNSSDVLNGGGGTNDQLGLDGDYTITLGGNFSNIEVVVLMRGPSAALNHFEITAANSLVAAGQTMTVFGLQVETAITFDGTAETDGAFRIYGGITGDALTGGGGADWIFGGNGADNLFGGGGNDVFHYDDVAQSTADFGDTIFDFASGDKIDVSGIDAIAGGGGGNDAFTYLGESAFTNHAGELRIQAQDGSTYLLQGDTNGDGNADFQLTFDVGDAHAITAADFTF